MKTKYFFSARETTDEKLTNWVNNCRWRKNIHFHRWIVVHCSLFSVVKFGVLTREITSKHQVWWMTDNNQDDANKKSTILYFFVVANFFEKIKKFIDDIQVLWNWRDFSTRYWSCPNMWNIGWQIDWMLLKWIQR